MMPRALAQIFAKMIEDLALQGVTKLHKINTGLSSARQALKGRANHLIILVKNQAGMKNLYKLFPRRMEYFSKVPRVPHGLLNKHREGLIIGSACEAGELYRAVVDGRSFDELCAIADYYDYLEVQPLGNNEYMVRDHIVDSIEQVQEFNKTILRIGEKLGQDGGHTGDVHFIEAKDSIYRAVLQAGKGLRMQTIKRRFIFAPTEICSSSSVICLPKKPMKLC